jgi:CBS domain-containing protein
VGDFVGIKAKDIMTSNVVTLKKEMGVKEAAEILLEKGIGGAPVVDDEGNVVGMVTESDLIMEDVKLHFPTFIHLLSGIIYLESIKAFEEKLKKAAAVKVEDVMSKKVISVTEDASIEDIATLMIEKGISRVPVVREGKLVGLVSKRDIVRTIAQS